MSRGDTRHPKSTILASFLVVLSSIPVYLRLGHEFMPPLNEGTARNWWRQSLTALIPQR